MLLILGEIEDQEENLQILIPVAQRGNTFDLPLTLGSYNR